MINYLTNKILLLIFLFTPILGWSGYEVVKCTEGQADLTEVNFSDTYARLNGDWEFYYEQLLSPKDLQTVQPDSYGQIPGFWKHYGKGMPKFGYATYKLKFNLSKEQLIIPLTLRETNIHNAYKVWINGKVVAEVGTVGDSYETSVPRWLPLIIHMKDLQEENEIVIQTCNFRHRNGGIQDAFEIGKTSDFYSDYRHQYFSEVFLSGSAFILGCFFLGMFFFWKQDRAALYFGFFSFAFSLRIMLVGTRSIGYTFENIPWDVLVRGEYIVMFCMHYFMFHFVYHAFKLQTNKHYLTVLKIATVILVVICLIPGDYFTYLTIPNNYYLLVTFIYTVYIFVRGLKEGVPGAIWAILAMAIFFLTTIPMILEYSNLFIADPIILNLSYIGFMLSMSLVFAARFGFAFSYLETLKDNEVVQKKEILEQKESIEKSNQLINQSINYARGIQQNLLPSDNELRNIFGECFVFFKPEGKVSGDFYWCKQKHDDKSGLIAVADCTGHGVPGAFISLIAISALENLIERTKIVNTSKILSELNSIINSRLKGHNTDPGVQKEGLDIGICNYNKETKTLAFSAAHHNLLVVRKSGDHEVICGDRHNLGMPLSFDFEFERHEIKLDEGDQIYMFTDGVYDQKGGVKGKKLYLNRMIEVLVQNKDLPMHRQKIEFEEFMSDWMKNKTQMDDMLLFGMRA